MQLKERDGIACDLCGTAYKTEFNYLSWDFRQSQVQDNMRPSLDHIHSMQVVFSLDVCTSCWEKFKPKIIKNYASTMSKTRRVPVGITCELTGEKLTGSFSYYNVDVTKVGVSMKGQPNICPTCKTKTYESGAPCKGCGGKDFIQLAKTNTEQRFVELNISEGAFVDLRTTAENIRKTAGQWTTT